MMRVPAGPCGSGGDVSHAYAHALAGAGLAALAGLAGLAMWDADGAMRRLGRASTL